MVDQYDYYTESDFERDREEERIAELEWRLHLFNLMATFNVTMATAIRWDLDSSNALHGGEYDAGLYCYNNTLPYNLAPAIVEIVRDESPNFRIYNTL